jgi:hypothetical protein
LSAGAERQGQLQDALTLEEIIDEINCGNQLPLALQMHSLQCRQEDVGPQLV